MLSAKPRREPTMRAKRTQQRLVASDQAQRLRSSTPHSVVPGADRRW
jgi:hypothetical protein